MEHELNSIITGDSLIVLKSFPDESLDLVITSPPYFQQREYGGTGLGNETTEQAYLDNLLAVFSECVRTTKATGAIVFNLGDKYIDGSLSLLPYKFAIQAQAQFGLRLINQVVWTKLNPTPRQDKRKLVQAAEPFFVFVKSSGYTFNHDAFMAHLDFVKSAGKSKPTGNIGKRYFDLIDNSDLTSNEKKHAKRELEKVIGEVLRGDLESFRMKIRNIHAEPFGGQEGGRKIHLERDGFTIIRIIGKTMKKDVIESPVESIKGNEHPAVYPLYVVQQLIKLLTNEGDTVLDPFAGSGTTCVAAQLLKRKFIGVEINPDYVRYAKERLAETESMQMEMLLL
jgi:DNA modification methylase